MLGKDQTSQDLGRPAFDASLQEYCDKNYHQLLPIIAEKVHQEKVQQENLKAVKTYLNFEEASQYIESGTSSRKRDLRKRLGSRCICSTSGSPEPRRGRSESPRKRDLERKTVFKRLEKGVFHRLGDKGKRHPHTRWKLCQKVKVAHEDIENQNQKRQKSSIEEDDLSQPWSRMEEVISVVETARSWTEAKLREGRLLELTKVRAKAGKIEKRNTSKFYEFHREVGHTTNECMHLKRKIKEMLKAGKLSYLIKELKQSNGKDQAKAAKKEETSGKDKSLAFLMVQPWQKVSKQRITQTFSPKTVILFPPLGEEDGMEGPMIIKTKMGDISSTACIWTGAPLQKSCDEEHLTSAWMNFMVVRSPSPYKGIIGRPGVRRIQAVPSTTHGMLKFPVTGGTVTLRSSRIISLEFTMVLGPGTRQPIVDQVTKEKIQVAIHLEYLKQTIAIGSTLIEEGRKELCGLLRRNLDIFAWKPADMTGVPRHIAEHRLNIREGCLPVRQKKKGQAPERNKAIYGEVEKLVNLLKYGMPCMIATALHLYWLRRNRFDIYKLMPHLSYSDIISSTANWRGDKGFQPSKNSTWSPREITLYLLFVFNRSKYEFYMKDDIDISALTIEQYIALIPDDIKPGMVNPKIGDDVKFEINANFMRELRRKLFAGTDDEDAYEHVHTVLEIVDLFHFPGVTHDAIMLRVFPITLKGRALRWKDMLPAGSITTWDLLKKEFIWRYCHPFITAKKLEEIYNFKQERDETLYYAWERYNDLLYQCLLHDLNYQRKVHIFYTGLDIPTRKILDSNGFIPLITQALESIQVMADHSHNWYDETTTRERINDVLDNVDAIHESFKGEHLNKEFSLKKEMDDEQMRKILENTELNIRALKTRTKNLQEKAYQLTHKVLTNTGEKVKAITTMGKENMKELVPHDLPPMPFLGHLKEQMGSPYRTRETVHMIGNPKEIHNEKAQEDEGDIDVVVPPCIPLGLVHDKDKIVKEKEQDYDIPLNDSVMQPLTPQMIHITQPDDDYVAPATNPISNMKLNKFEEEFSHITEVAEKEYDNPQLLRNNFSLHRNHYSYDVTGAGYSLKDKNKAKLDKTEHGFGKSAKN
ncbi:reverse transcriptase domain-containing protein [Tanacetum coccineum]